MPSPKIDWYPDYNHILHFTISNCSLPNENVQGDFL